MTDRYRSGDDLILPFIFIPHGAPEPPEVAAFKARYPGWFTIPATFVPRAPSAPDHLREEAQSQERHPRELNQSGARHLSPEQAFECSSVTLNDPGSAVGITRVAVATPSVSGNEQAYVGTDPEQWIDKPSVGTGECVALVQQATGAPHTSHWQRGALVKGNINIRPGTGIATFDSNGRYGNHTNGTSHAAIYLRQDAEGIHVIDQWNVREHGHVVRHLAPHERIIRFNHSGGQPIDQGNSYYVIE